VRADGQAVSDLDLTRERMERWATDPNPNATLFGIEQDEDLIVGQPENVPLLCEYLDRRDLQIDKRTFIVLAMAEMLLLERSDHVTDEIAATLEATLLRNRDAVVASFDVVGVEVRLLLRRLLGHSTFSYRQGPETTVLVASPTPGRDAWDRFVKGALAHLEADGVEFPAGRTHFRGVFVEGIRARYRDRELTLRCHTPGELIVEHREMRPSHVPGILRRLEFYFGLEDW
jgi:hypothetical protein